MSSQQNQGLSYEIAFKVDEDSLLSSMQNAIQNIRPQLETILGEIVLGAAGGAGAGAGTDEDIGSMLRNMDQKIDRAMEAWDIVGWKATRTLHEQEKTIGDMLRQVEITYEREGEQMGPNLKAILSTFLGAMREAKGRREPEEWQALMETPVKGAPGERTTVGARLNTILNQTSRVLREIRQGGQPFGVVENNKYVIDAIAKLVSHDVIQNLRMQEMRETGGVATKEVTLRQALEMTGIPDVEQRAFEAWRSRLDLERAQEVTMEDFQDLARRVDIVGLSEEGKIIVEEVKTVAGAEDVGDILAYRQQFDILRKMIEQNTEARRNFAEALQEETGMDIDVSEITGVEFRAAAGRFTTGGRGRVRARDAETRELIVDEMRRILDTLLEGKFEDLSRKQDRIQTMLEDLKRSGAPGNTFLDEAERDTRSGP